MNDWICSKCNKEPKVMHSCDPNICVECYDKSEPGPPPTFNPGDRVTTPQGKGAVVYVIHGIDARSSSICVKLDAGRNYPHYHGTLILAELVKAEAKPKRR